MVMLTPQQQAELELQQGLLREMAENPQLLAPLQTGVLYQQSPAAVPTPNSPVLSEAPATGNKRDSVDVVQRSGNALPEYQAPRLRDLIFGKSGDHGDKLLRFSLGLLSGRNLAEGLVRGMQAFDESVAQEKADFYAQQDREMQAERFGMEKERHRQDMQRGELDIDRLRQAIKMGMVKDLGNGLFYDFSSGQTIDVPEAYRRELEIVAAKARIESQYRQPVTPDFQQGLQFRAPNGDIIAQSYDGLRNTWTLQNITTGETLSQLPEGAVPVTQAGLGKQNALAAEAEDSAWSSANSAYSMLDNIATLRQIGPNIAGPDLWTSAMRTLAQITGTDISGIDPDDVSQAKHVVANMLVELRKGQRGLGPLSDQESKALERALANPETLTPEALKLALDDLEGKQRYAIELWESWANQSDVSDFRRFESQFRKWWRENRQRKGDEQAGSTGTTGTAGGVKWRLISP